jgi:hypothetical protein
VSLESSDVNAERAPWLRCLSESHQCGVSSGFSASPSPRATDLYGYYVSRALSVPDRALCVTDPIGVPV